MQTIVATFLLMIAITLFWAWRTHKISNNTLNAFAAIFTVIAGIAAIILFLIPAASPPPLPNETSIPEPSEDFTMVPTNIELPTMIPEPTSPATLTAVVEIAPNVLLQDDFIDNKNGWLLQNGPSIKSDIIGGKYKYSIACPQTHEDFYCGNYIGVPGLTSKDLQLELDAAMKNVSPGTEVIIAFQFRLNASNYYNIYFRSIGKYTINRFYNGSVGKLLEDTTIPSFSPNVDAANRYGFSASDVFLSPLFNGQELLFVEDGFINQAGSVSIGIFVLRGGTAVVELDNLIAIDKSK